MDFSKVIKYGIDVTPGYPDFPLMEKPKEYETYYSVTLVVRERDMEALRRGIQKLIDKENKND